MRIGEKIYHCRRIVDEDIVSYSEPKTITLKTQYCTVQPESGYLSTLKYGEAITDYQRMVLYPYERWNKQVSEGDVFYLLGDHPDRCEADYGDNANFEVDNVAAQNRAIVVTLKRRK